MKRNPTYSFSLKRLFDELLSSDFADRVKKHSTELQNFYLSEEQLRNLAEMNTAKRFVSVMFWVMKALILKLTLWRRVLFVAAILLTLNVQSNGENIQGNVFLGMTAFILLILLELKDKLLAHDELAEGRKIQQALMPETKPNISGYSLWLYTRSANEVCGDLIDILELDENRKALVIADVAGKGLHAALLTTKLQATMRALAYDDYSPPKLIQRINAIFHRDSPANIFASLMYFELTSQSNIIQCVNAGHLPALIVHNTIVEELPKGDPAIGLSHAVRYSQKTITLNPGNVLLAYSDGVTDAKNMSGEFFGKERLLKFLSENKHTNAENIGLGLITELDRFVKNEHQTDDISLIVIQRL